jgi:hypothetical protein
MKIKKSISLFERKTVFYKSTKGRLIAERQTEKVNNTPC